MRPPVGRILCLITAILALSTSVSHLRGYGLTGLSWPDGDIAMRLQLGSTGVVLQDGSGTWNNSAADALALWNQQLNFVHLSWTESEGPGAMADGVNSVFFSSTIFGEDFGTNVLAVTVYRYEASTQRMLETDTLFNTAQSFNSYRGPLQFDSGTGALIFDFHRVALHEFGHTLGLAHPDESGQSVVALMNSVISDLDHLAADDIAGGRFLYGPRFISETNINGNVGDPLYLPLTTNPPATSITLNYLPPGLSYNSATRVISGTPTRVGESVTAVVANTSNGAVSANLHFAIGPPAHAFQTFLDFHYASDYYASQTHTFYTATHNLRVVRDEFNRVVVNVGNGLPRIHFQAEGFQPLQPGFYPGAVASVYGSGGQTALEIIGEGSGCAEGAGAFTVHEIIFGARETILSFWATFEQDCVDGLGSHHTGEIRYHVDADDPLVVPVVSAPASLEINQGGHISFQVSANNGATTYAAFGLPLGVTCSPAGQVSGTPIVAGVFVARLFATNNLGTGETTTAITIHPGPERPHSLLNVSTRGRVGTGDNLMIAGFIITGAEQKTVVLRGLGPSLPVAGALADPFLRLTLPVGVTGIDNWLDVYYPIYYGGWQSVVGTGLAPGHRLEPALVYNLDPGQYTMGLFGVNNTTGVAVVEAYDITPYDSSLANISTRGHVGTGDDVLIGGFIIGGNERTDVVVRAIGPTLAQSGVPGSLADPTLELYDGNGAALVQNDDWRTSQEQELIDSGLAPTNDLESALLLALEPGRYTAIVRGKNSGTGVGLVEVYNLDAN